MSHNDKNKEIHNKKAIEERGKALSEGNKTGKSKKIFLIFTAIFLGLVLLLGIVLGTVSAIRDSRSVMSYKGIYLEEGVVNYLATSYKYTLMSTLRKLGINCTDTESFWQRRADAVKTYADVLRENTDRYVKSVLVGSYMFDRNTKLSRSDKRVIENSISQVLEYKADGDVDKFNEISAPMGFDYDDFEKAAELMYKFEMAQTVIFGYEAAALQSGGFYAECDEYFEENYSRVRLLIVRTDGELVTDPDTGKETLREYTSKEKAEALAKIEDIRAKIQDGRMNEEAFKWHIQNEYPTDTVNDEKGYYFSSSSEYSQNFASEGGLAAVKLALSMGVGEYAECELDIGICFIYKCELEDRAYASYALERFFEDFYIKAAPSIYVESLATYFSDIKIKDKYNSESVVTLPYNYQLAISFS